MNLRTRGRCRVILGALGLVVAVGVPACGGSHSPYPDASVQFDVHPGTGGGTGDAGTRPPPAVGDGVVTLATGPAFLVGTGQNSCTNQDPPSGDRWCAFTLPSSFLGSNDLWVINVSRAIEGTPIRCDVSDLNCLLLSSTLYTGDLTAHGFFGDTLVFYDNTGAASAWRPGLLAARKLNTNVILGGCAGHPKNDAVRCLQHPDSTVTGQTSLDLTAGNVLGGTGLLSKVATFIATFTTDPASTATLTQPTHYRAGLSSDGKWIAWSARPTAGGVETLMTQKIGDDSTRVTVAEDVSRWTFSRDNGSLYWLKTFNYSATTPLGALQSTPFPPPPAGTAPVITTVRPAVSLYVPAGDKGLLVLGPQSNAAGQLSLIADSSQPGQAKILSESVTQITSLSPDGREAVYSRTSTDLYANGLDLASECTLTTTAADVPFGVLSDPPSTVYWINPDATANALVGKYTNLASCQSQTFASGLIVIAPVKDQGLVFGDGVVGDSAGNADVTLRYAAMTNGTLPASGTSIQQRANPTFSVMLPYLSGVVFTVNAGGGTDGIYVRSLPFAATPMPPPPAPPDASVDTASVDAGAGPGDAGSDQAETGAGG